MNMWHPISHSFAWIVVFGSVLVFTPCLAAQSGTSLQPPFSQDRIIVAFRPGTAEAGIK